MNNMAVKVNAEASMIMLDEKLGTLLSGLHGAFCLLCSITNDCVNDIEEIKAGFITDRSLEIMNAMSDKNLHCPGRIRRGSYKARKDVNQEPITIDNSLSSNPLHMYLRSLDLALKLCYHNSAGYHRWHKTSMEMKLVTAP